MPDNKLDIYSYIGYIHLLVIGAIGNALIIAYFVKTNSKNLQKTTTYHFLLTILAFADISVAIGVPILYFTRNNWSTNKIVCKYVNELLGVQFPSYSVWVLVLISYERYRKMVYPFKAPIKKKILIVVLVFTMAMCIGFNVPMMESKDIINNRCSSFTKVLNSQTSIIAFYISSICFDCLLPLIAMLWFYYKISVNITHFHHINKSLDETNITNNSKITHVKRLH